jgi:hypothetical protein
MLPFRMDQRHWILVRGPDTHTQTLCACGTEAQAGVVGLHALRALFTATPAGTLPTNAMLTATPPSCILCFTHNKSDN